MTDKQLLKALVEKRPVVCPECGSKLRYIGSGEYECIKCGDVILDDFGKVKRFLRDNGTTSIPVITAATGVSSHLVTEMLKSGRIEIIEHSKAFISCEKCGCAIRYGRICPDCVQSGLMGLYHDEEIVVGEKPDPKKKLGRSHGMRYYDEKTRKRHKHK